MKLQIKKYKEYANIFWQLLKTDLTVYTKDAFGDIIDTAIVFSSIILIVTYVYPSLGMDKSFGAFYAIGMIASLSFFEIYSTVSSFISDLEGNKKISHSLTIPMPSFLVFIEIAIYHAIRKTFATSIILPLSKLILGSRINLSQLSIVKFVLIFLTLHLAIGFLAIVMASTIARMSKMRQVFVRFLFPLWIFSGIEFPWHILNNIYPRLGKLIFVNPLLYAMEGIRAATFGQGVYLSFWLCFCMLWFFIVLFGYVGVVRFKKRLDFVG